MLPRHFPVCLIGSAHHVQLPVHIGLVQEQCLVLLVIIVKLRIRHGSAVTGPCDLILADPAQCPPIDHRLQSHCLKLPHSFPHHPLKAQLITDIYRLFPGQILAGFYKSRPISFGKGTGHRFDLLRCTAVQEPGRIQLIVRDVLSVPVQIPQIRKVTVHHDPYGKVPPRINGIQNPLCSKHIGIITEKPVKSLPDSCRWRIFPFFCRRCEQAEDLYEKLQ